MKKVLNCAAAALVAAMLLGSCGGAKEKAKETAAPAKEAASGLVIKVGLTTAETHSSYLSVMKFKEEVEKSTNGKLKVEVYPNAQLGNDRESIEGVQMGSITMTVISSALVAQFEPGIAIFDLPFLFPDRTIAYRMFTDPAIGGELAKRLEGKGFKCLAFWEAGYRNLTNSKKEIKKPADLKGMKVRTMSNPYHVQAWTDIGASPTPVAFSELYTALQQKTVDGQENPWGLILAQKFYEVQKYASTTGHILTVMPFIMNKQFYDGLSDDLKKAVADATVVATEFNHQAAQKEEVDAKKQLQEKGMKIYEMSAEEKAVFQKAAAGVYEKMKKDLGAELIDKVKNFK